MKIACINLFKPMVMLIIFAPVLVSCGKSGNRNGDTSPVPVRMTPVTAREVAEEVKGFGSLSFLKKFELLSSVDGVLDVLHFREGDRIDKDDIVGVLRNPQITLAARRAEDAYSQALAAMDLASARLRDSELSAEARLLEIEKSQEELAQAERVLEEEKRKSRNREAMYVAGGLSDEAIREERFRLASAETQISFMEKELEVKRIGFRVEDLAAAGISVPAGKEDLRRAIVRMVTSAIRAEAAAARASLEAASREVESCRLMEEDLQIKSPGLGIVGARYVEEGERIKREDKILTILDTESLYAIFPIPESEAPKLNKGMSAIVASGGNESYEGIVDLVSPQADNQSFTFLVRILLVPREGSYLKPGMFAHVSIPMENPRKLTVIPEAALAAKKDNAGRVFTIQNNVLSERNVVLGSLLGDEREIISGLTPGEVVVLGPNPALKEGVYVSMAE
jgi:RND family efflux transporter MFP subunit